MRHFDYKLISSVGILTLCCFIILSRHAQTSNYSQVHWQYYAMELVHKWVTGSLTDSWCLNLHSLEKPFNSFLVACDTCKRVRHSKKRLFQVCKGLNTRGGFILQTISTTFALNQARTTYLWCVWCVKQSEFSEGFVGRCVGAVRDRGPFPVVLGVQSLRWPPVQRGRLPRRRRAVGEEYGARGAQVGRGAEALLVPLLHVVVPTGLVEGADAAVQPFIGAVASHRPPGVYLHEAGVASGAVVNVLDRFILPVARRELELLSNGASFGARGSVAMASEARHVPRVKPQRLRRRGKKTRGRTATN